MAVSTIRQRIGHGGRRLALSAVVCCLLAPAFVLAQEREDQPGDRFNQSLLHRLSLAAQRTALDRATKPEEKESDGFQAPEYEPVSKGADAGQEEDDAEDRDAVSIFDLNRDSPFGDTVRPAGPRESRRSLLDGDGEDAADSGDRSSALRGQGADAAPEPDDDVAVTGTVPEGRIDALDEERNRPARTSSERTGAIEGLEPDDAEDPYAPLGIRVGAFTLFPELEQGLSWSSNADSSASGGEAVLSETTLRLRAQSDWARHSARIEAFGTFRQSISGTEVSEPSGGVDAELRLDLVNGFAALAAFEYEVTPESAASTVVIPGTVSQPLLHRLAGSLGVARNEGKFRLAATGRVERLDYGDADLGGGMVFSQRERDSTLAALTLRTGYEVSPAIVPFVEVEIGRRIHDLRVDTAGYARSADRYGVRAGVELDIGEKLRGEFAAGWIVEQPDDNRLAAIEGVSALAALRWSPARGTTINLDATTTIETTTQPGASGSILYDANLGVERQIRANLTGNLVAGLGYRDYSGSGDHDLIMDVEAGLTWWLNRNFGITGRGGYEVVESNIAGRDSDTASVFLGVRLRR